MFVIVLENQDHADLDPLANSLMIQEMITKRRDPKKMIMKWKLRNHNGFLNAALSGPVFGSG